MQLQADGERGAVIADEQLQAVILHLRTALRHAVRLHEICRDAAAGRW